MLAGLQRTQEPQWRVATGRNHVSHASLAVSFDQIAYRSDIRATIENRHGQAQRPRHQSGNLPIRQMRGEYQARLLAIAEPLQAHIAGLI